ncbi:EIS1 [Candida theae]|uniref:EIS1 n=1 Tax=Candida theae TaxID=1198502 RepID=A0AAD5FWZ1_9ASCO|nr:EIS1 [Candida theae]KAI5950093.1 EIS1 [Candida theae]
MSHSVYQTSGKPLSKEALYHQRLKQGVFQSPSGTIVGVNSNASDTAALLAASSDLTVKPSYERTVAAEAHTAALAAKPHDVNIWKRHKEDSDAAEAALSSHSKADSLTSQSTQQPNTIVRVGIPSALDKGSIYKVAQEKSSSTMTSRIDPIRDVSRSGIQSKYGAQSLNISKINQVATKKSSSTLNSRFNPELDYRSGLKKDKPTEFLNQEEEDLAASGANASLYKTPTVPDYANQTRSNTFKAQDVVNSTLLAAAAAKANDRLSTLNANTPQTLKAQAQLYANALAVAQKNSDERSKNRVAGVINLGGGLTITQAELNQLAATYVQPVIDDIEQKADSKREIELSKKQRKAELKAAHERAKQEQQAAKAKEKQDIEKAKQERVTANEKSKKAEDQKLVEHEKARNEEVAAKQLEYEELEKKHAEEKEQLLAEKKEKQDEIDAEEAAKNEERSKELDELQAEKDEIAQPVLDELEQENAKLKEITDERDALTEEVDGIEQEKNDREKQVEELNDELEETQLAIDKLVEELRQASEKHETTDKELADLKTKEAQAKDEHANETSRLDGEIADLQKEKDAKTEEKANKKKEILGAIDEKVKFENRVNDELPPHLKRDINEEKLRDTGSLFAEDEKPKAKAVATESKESKPLTSGESEASRPTADKVDVGDIKPIPLIAVADKHDTSAEIEKPKNDATKAAEKAAASSVDPKTVEKKEASTATASKAGASSSSTAAAAAGAKKPSTTTTPPSPSKKEKASFGRRLSNFFKDQSKAPAPAKSTTTKSTPAKSTPAKSTPATSTKATKNEAKDAKTATTATTTPSTKQPAGKDAEKEAKSLDPKANKRAAAADTKDSEDGDYGDYVDVDDDLSLNKKQNERGVFKEDVL